jgi:hypothetical protein
MMAEGVEEDGVGDDRMGASDSGGERGRAVVTVFLTPIGRSVRFFVANSVA